MKMFLISDNVDTLTGGYLHEIPAYYGHGKH